MQVVVFSLDAVGTLCCDDDLPHCAYLFVLDVVDHLQLFIGSRQRECDKSKVAAK